MVEKKGIDISVWQGNINWEKVKSAGIEFAMLRCGFGKNSHQKDTQFETNYKNAKAAGVPVGVYHYSYATSVADAEKEADFCLSLLKGKQFEYPIAFDIEDKIQRDLGKELISKIIVAFCEKVEKAGYYVCIYANKDWLVNRIDTYCKTRYDVWIAEWTKKPTYNGQFGLWQYSSKGNVNGISGNVDMNIAYKDYPSIIKGAKLNGFTENVVAPAPDVEPAPVTYKAGQAVVLKDTPLYTTATSNKALTKKSGTYYIYDGIKINGRYRITNRPDRVGKKHIGFYVSGFIVL